MEITEDKDVLIWLLEHVSKRDIRKTCSNNTFGTGSYTK